MNNIEIEHKADYWLLSLSQMKENGVISSRQHAEVSRKVKAWIYDNLKGFGEDERE